MLANTGEGVATWFPLNAEGYWADPEAFSKGLITRRCPLSSATEAEQAMWRARKLNLGDPAAS